MWTLVAGPFTSYAIALSSRARTPKLNREQLFAYNMSYPSLKEQRRIVAHLDNLQEKANKLKRLQEETSKELDSITQSVLSKAFTGEL